MVPGVPALSVLALAMGGVAGKAGAPLLLRAYRPMPPVDSPVRRGVNCEVIVLLAINPETASPILKKQMVHELTFNTLEYANQLRPLTALTV